MTTRPLVIAIAVAAVVNLAGSALFVWSSYEARQQNCRAVREAFDAYTDALVIQSGRSLDDPEAEDFRDAYRSRLEECH